MIDFIDKTAEKNGTPINRVNMMAIQGFTDFTTTFEDNVLASEVYDDGSTYIAVEDDDKNIIETFTGPAPDKKTIIKKTIFKEDGSIRTEVIS